MGNKHGKHLLFCVLLLFLQIKTRQGKIFYIAQAIISTLNILYIKIHAVTSWPNIHISTKQLPDTDYWRHGDTKHEYISSLNFQSLIKTTFPINPVVSWSLPFAGILTQWKWFFSLHCQEVCNAVPRPLETACSFADNILVMNVMWFTNTTMLIQQIRSSLLQIMSVHSVSTLRFTDCGWHTQSRPAEVDGRIRPSPLGAAS